MNKKFPMKFIGLDGNSFSIMGRFRQLARRAGWTKDEIKAVMDEATSGDYYHLLATFMAHTSGQADGEQEWRH